MIYTLDVTGSNGTPFRVLVIPASDEGPHRHRAPSGRDYAIVEFYDRRHQSERGPDVNGQFTGGSYDIRTLLGRRGWYSDGMIGSDGHGLDLHGGVPAWTLDPDACALVRDWLLLLDARVVLN